MYGTIYVFYTNVLRDYLICGLIIPRNKFYFY